MRSSGTRRATAYYNSGVTPHGAFDEKLPSIEKQEPQQIEPRKQPAAARSAVAGTRLCRAKDDYFCTYHYYFDYYYYEDDVFDYYYFDYYTF